MSQGFPLPPPKLADARTVEYAVLGDDPDYSGHSSIFVNGEELGPVPCLAICQGLQRSEFLLLHCDSDWNVLGVSAYPSVADAKKHANTIYPGINENWMMCPSGRAQTETDSETDSEDFRCAICGKKPEEVTAIIEAGRIRVCDGCIRDLYQMLAETEKE